MRNYAPTSFRSRLMPDEVGRAGGEGPRLLRGGSRGPRPAPASGLDQEQPSVPAEVAEDGAAPAGPAATEVAEAPRYGRPGLIRWSPGREGDSRRFLSIPDITGWEVRGENRQLLGKVVDIYVATESGEARFAVIGGGKRMVLAPVAALSVNEPQQVVSLSRRFQEVLQGPAA